MRQISQVRVTTPGLTGYPGADIESGPGGRMREDLERSKTRFLNLLRAEDSAAQEEFAPLLYEELYRLARRRGPPRGASFTPSDLVGELWVRLFKRQDGAWNDRHHFFATAARAVRHILADHRKALSRAKRQGNGVRVELDDPTGNGGEDAIDLVALVEALEHIEQKDETLARILELRLFTPCRSQEDVARALGIGLRTIQRRYSDRLIEAMLYRELRRGS